MQDKTESKPYKALGKKLLMVDELPPGALSKYERDVQVQSYVIGKRGATPNDDLMVPYAPNEKLKDYMMQWMNDDQNHK